MNTQTSAMRIIVLILLFGFVACSDESSIVDNSRTSDTAMADANLKTPKVIPDISLSPSGDVSGVTDADNIENALAAAASGDVIKLEPGTYYINRSIAAPLGFHGTLTGAGSGKTVINGVGDNVLPFANAVIHNPGNPFPIVGGAFFYFPEPSESLEVSHLSMELPAGFQTDLSGFGNLNLVSFLAVTLGSDPADTRFTGLKLNGTAAEPTGPAFLISQPLWGIAVMGDRDPVDFPIPSYPGGIHEVTDSEINNIGLQATLHEVMLDARITSSGNRFSAIKQTIYRWLADSKLQITRNELDAFSFGSIVVTQEGFPMAGDRNSVEISHNSINTQGFMGIEIGFISDPGGASFDLLIEKNTITKSGPDPVGFFPNLTGIGLSPGNSDAVIRNNTVRGDADFGILLDGFDAGFPYGVDNSMLQANNLQGLSPNAADYGLFFSSNNTIVGRGNSTVIEFGGSGNIITGLQKVPGETIGNRMKTAHDNVKDILAGY